MSGRVYAQRATDKLDRGLVAVKTSSGVFTSWRIFGEEYYGVTYNVYRDGERLNEKPLSVSNFVDAGGTLSSRYTVRAVVDARTEQYEEPFPGAREKLVNALTVMTLAYLASEIKHRAEVIYETVIA